MAGPRDILSPFNRYVASVTEVLPLKNNALNAVLFIGTTKTEELRAYSGAISNAEIEKISTVKELTDKISKALSQKDIGGNAILPERFYVAGFELETGSINDVEMMIKKAVVDYQAQAITVVFDNPKSVLAKEGFIESFETILNSWDSWAIFTIDSIDEVKEQMKSNSNSRIILIKSHKTGENTYEKNSDAALAGRVIFFGVGKVDGEAKELYGITTDKLSIAEGDGGDLTVSEATKWTDDNNINIYVQTVDMKNETSGMKLLSGKEFINSWELAKVKLDLRNDLIDFRHNNERLGVSDLDESQVRGIIIDRLNRLKINTEDPELNPNGILVDYIVKSIPLDRTLEDNIFKFKFSIKVSLSGILKYFDLSITGYTDGRILVNEGGAE